MTTDSSQATTGDSQAVSRARILCWVLSGGIGVFIARLVYERLVLHINDRALFFGILHSDYALVFWAALMCFLLAHLWVPLALLWIAIRHRAWRGLLPFVA